MALHVLDRETTATVPYLHCSVVWAWNKHIRVMAEANATRPLWMSFVGLVRSRWVSLVPHSDLPIFMCWQNWIGVGIEGGHDWVSGKNGLFSSHFDDICYGDLVCTWCWDDFLIAYPVQAFDCSFMYDFRCQFRKHIQFELDLFLLVFDTVMYSSPVKISGNLPDSDTSFGAPRCDMVVCAWAHPYSAYASLMFIWRD